MNKQAVQNKALCMQKSVVWFLALSVVAGVVVAKPGDGDCVVADFRTLALTVHNPTERLAAATQWLQSHGDACSLKDIALIKSSSPAWLGSADSPLIQQTMDRYYNAKAKGAKDEPPPAAVQVNPPAATSVAAVPPKPKAVEASAAKPNAASKASAASGAAATPADAINNGIAAAVAAAAASKAASSIAKTSAAK